MNGILRTLALLAFIILFATGFSGCGPDNASETTTNGSATPANPIDALINEYEKAAHDYVRVEKKHREGDVSVTMQVINGDERTRKLAAQLQQESAKMTPAQSQRVAEISARTASYLLK